MTKKNGTKRSLLMSAVALVLCFSMLVGSTFAWFTDSVTSSGNIIASGKLDVEMYWANGTADPANTTWNDASTGTIFNYDKWEPGYVEAKHVKISNVGTLAFKYKLNIVANGEVSKLADVIDVYYLSTAQAVTRDMIAAATPVGTLAQMIADPDGAAYGTLEATGTTEKVVTIALKMRESAGNEYQELSIGSDFSVQLLAAQLEAEIDSFDNTYDKFADYDGEISTADALATALAKGGTYKVVSDIDADEAMTVPAGVTVNLDLNGKEIEGTVGRDANNNRVHTLVNNGTLNLVGGTVTSAGDNGGSAIYNADGATLTVENVTLNGAPQEGSTWPSYTVNNYGTLTVSDSSINGVQGIIATNNTANTTVNNVIAYRDGWSSGHVFYTSSTAKVTINGGTYTNDGNGVDGTMFCGGETVVNGGTFIVQEGAYFALSSGSKLTVNGGDFSNIKSCIAWGGAMTISGGTFGFDPTTYVADGYVTTDNGDGTWTVGAKKVSASDANTAIAAGGAFELTEDVTISSDISNNANINLNGKTFEATTTLELKNNSDLTMTGGDYVVNSTYGHVDVRPSTAEGSTVVFEDVNFSYNKKGPSYGPSTNRLGSVVEVCATVADAKTEIVFKNCTFDNAQVLFEGMSGKTGEFVATFENCTFNALTSSAPIYVQNYVKGTLNVIGCTFNLECTSSTASAISVSSSSSTTVTVNAENNTINAVAATPYTFDAAAGETEVDNVKVNGTPANIKFISYLGTVSTMNETGTVKTGIAG